ncbi:MAG: hypothetical protein AAF765_13195 [Bacteroidota bacterium]
MTYKTKSLLYFFCFLITATAYYVVEQYEDYNNQIQSAAIAETFFDGNMDLEHASEKESETPQ